MLNWLGGKAFGWVTGLLGGLGGYVAVGLVSGVIAFTAAWKYQAATYGAEISGIRLAYSEAATEGLRRQQVQRAQQDLARAEIDATKTRELKDAHQANETLARAVAAGDQRLRVKAACPAGAGQPATAGAAGLDAAASPELTAAARQDYFALRAEIAERDIQREALIDYVEMLTRQREPQK